jgi:hypothetical protein
MVRAEASAEHFEQVDRPGATSTAQHVWHKPFAAACRRCSSLYSVLDFAKSVRLDRDTGLPLSKRSAYCTLFTLLQAHGYADGLYELTRDRLGRRTATGIRKVQNVRRAVVAGDNVLALNPELENVA